MPRAIFNIQTEYLEILRLLWNCYTPYVVGMFVAEMLLTLKAFNKLQQIGLIQKNISNSNKSFDDYKENGEKRTNFL